MQTLPIVLYPQSILQKRAEEISGITPQIQELIPQMINAMYANQGIGLAAPQIGISKRVIIVETSDNPRGTVRGEGGKPFDKARGRPLAFLNPRIVKKTKEQAVEEEGCLSLPEIFLPVKRAKKIEVTCETPDGKEVKIQAEGLIARIFQHEVDHLNGKLIINRVSLLKRLKIKKLLKNLEKKQIQETYI